MTIFYYIVLKYFLYFFINWHQWNILVLEYGHSYGEDPENLELLCLSEGAFRENYCAVFICRALKCSVFKSFPANG